VTHQLHYATRLRAQQAKSLSPLRAYDDDIKRPFGAHANRCLMSLPREGSRPARAACAQLRRRSGRRRRRRRT
jgi:hypothetical protein